MLFEERERSYFGPRRWAESHYSFLNRSANSTEAGVRAVMNQWFAAYPESARADLRGRFRSKVHGQHAGALNELFLHELFRRLGYRLDVTPVGSDNVSRPDFLLTSDATPNFDLEATVAEISVEERKRRQRANVIYDTIDRIRSPNFMLAIESWSGPDTDLPSRKLRDELREWIDGLDFNSIVPGHQLDDLPTYDFCHDDWRIKFWAMPVQSEGLDVYDDRIIGMRVTGIQPIDTIGDIRRALDDKTTKYGARDRPFVIAVSTGSENPFFSIRSLRPALFGSGKEIMPSGVGIADTIWEDDAVFWRSGEPRNTRVSGVFVVIRLDAWNFATKTPIYMENPWAEHPLLDVPPVFDRWFGSKDDPASIHRPAERGLSEVFDLPEDWPEGEPDDP